MVYHSIPLRCSLGFPWLHSFHTFVSNVQRDIPLTPLGGKCCVAAATEGWSMHPQSTTTGSQMSSLFLVELLTVGVRYLVERIPELYDIPYDYN